MGCSNQQILKQAELITDSGETVIQRIGVSSIGCHTVNPPSKMIPKYWKHTCKISEKLKNKPISKIKIQLNPPKDYYSKTTHKTAEKKWLNVTIEEFKIFLN